MKVLLTTEQAEALGSALKTFDNQEEILKWRLNDLFSGIESPLNHMSVREISLAMFGELKILPKKICVECGNEFTQTHQHQKFCPPPNQTKISKCQNRFNMRAKRKRKKELSKLEGVNC